MTTPDPLAPVVYPVQGIPRLRYSVWVPAVVQLRSIEHGQAEARQAFLTWADDHLDWDVISRALAFARIANLPVLLYRWRICNQEGCGSMRHPRGLRAHYEPIDPIRPNARVVWRGLEVALPLRHRTSIPEVTLALPGDTVPPLGATVPPDRRRAYG